MVLSCAKGKCSCWRKNIHQSKYSSLTRTCRFSGGFILLPNRYLQLAKLFGSTARVPGGAVNAYSGCALHHLISYIPDKVFPETPSPRSLHTHQHKHTFLQPRDSTQDKRYLETLGNRDTAQWWRQTLTTRSSPTLPPPTHRTVPKYLLFTPEKLQSSDMLLLQGQLQKPGRSHKQTPPPQIQVFSCYLSSQYTPVSQKTWCWGQRAHIKR